MKAHPVRYRLEDAVAVAVSAGVRALPRRALPRVGQALGGLWRTIDRRHVAIAADNLRRAFPEWSEERVRETARGVYRHFATVLMELAWLPGRSRDDVMSFVEVSGLEHVDAALARGHGCLYVGAHFGNWEIHAISHAWRGYKVAVLARALDNPRLDARLCGVRQMSGNTIIYKRRALVQVLKSLREDRGVAILVDQNVQEKDGIFVPFFGRPAATTTVAAALAVKTGCALVPVRAVRHADGRYQAICEPAIEWTPSGDRAHDIRLLTEKMTAVIEGWIREHPEQWLWMHRRWKTQPKGDA